MASSSSSSSSTSWPVTPISGSKGGSGINFNGNRDDVRFHCGDCRKTFVSFAGVRTHCTASKIPTSNWNVVAPGQEGRVEGCCHTEEPQEVQMEFVSMEEAMNWLEEPELDKHLRIRTSSAKRKVFQCRSALKRQTKVGLSKQLHQMKPVVGSTIAPGVAQCPAKLTFLRVIRCQCLQPESQQLCLVNAQVIQVMGSVCHSHSIEKRDMRLSKAVKGYAADLLKSGLQPKVILNRHFPVEEQDDSSKPITRSDLYRMGQTEDLLGYDPKVSEVTNVTGLMSKPPFRAFNYGSKFDMSVFPDAVQHKVVETNGLFLLCYASEAMLQRFRDHPTIISVDGTHGTNSAKFVLISILVFDNRGEGTPVFQCLVENENKAIFSVALKVLKDLVPEACSRVKCLLSDTSHTFINAWEDVVGPVQWSVCHWHLEKNWTKHIKEPEMLQEIKGLRLIVKEDEFYERFESIKEK